MNKIYSLARETFDSQVIKSLDCEKKKHLKEECIKFSIDTHLFELMKHFRKTTRMGNKEPNLCFKATVSWADALRLFWLMFPAGAIEICCKTWVGYVLSVKWIASMRSIILKLALVTNFINGSRVKPFSWAFQSGDQRTESAKDVLL